MTTLFCNADAERTWSGIPDTAESRRALLGVARVFAVAGLPGSRVVVPAGDAVQPLDADALRADHPWYAPEVLRALPWASSPSGVLAYALDARAVARGAQGDAALVRRVNGKAWSAQHAREAGLEPGVFRHAEVMRSVDALRAWMERAPDEVVRAFTVKPCWGYAGGGRIPGAGRVPGEAMLHRVHALLQRDGEALVEPWVTRVQDVGTQLWVHSDGRVELLFQLVMRNTAGGRYVGHDDGVSVLHADVLAAGAMQVGRWLADAGYAGPAGVDAFTYRDPVAGELPRPVVEVNARFTMGILAGTAFRMARARGVLPARGMASFAFDAEHPNGARLEPA